MTHSRLTGIAMIAAATDSWFRGHSYFSDWLTTAGYPKTSDTGQVNWATVTVPASNTISAYEVRRFNDATQGTDPIYFRIDYTYITATNQYPRLRFTVGTGSDGAGNITGTPVHTPSHLTVSGQTTARQWVAGSDGSGFAVLAGLPTGSALARNFFSLERARKDDGTPYPGHVILTSTGSQTTSVNLNGPNTVMYNLLSGQAIASDSIPVFYWRDLSLSTSSLNLGSYYQFGVLTMPTNDTIVRTKLIVGVAYGDFIDQSILEVPRFTGGAVYNYFLDKQEVSSLAGAYGMSPSGAGTTSADSPASFAMPCIYWS